jgi:predicted secreted protein
MRALRGFNVALAAGACLFMAGAPQAALAQETPVQLTVGGTTTLLLDGNPSTGYTWVLDGAPSRVVSVELKGYVKPELKPGERPLLGKPQKFEVFVSGQEPGRASLVFKYVKAGTAAPGNTKTFAVEVLDEAQRSPDEGADSGSVEIPDPTTDVPVDSRTDMFADPNTDQDGGGGPDPD